MREFQFLILVLFYLNSFTQSVSESQIQPAYSLQKWDKTKSNLKFGTSNISYDKIPKNIDFRGTIVEAITWEDDLGTNLLLLTLSGGFATKKSNYSIEEKSELFAYLFTQKYNTADFERVWRIYDFVDCFGVDMQVDFIKNGTLITDLNENGIAEISIPYTLMCRGGLDPVPLKIIMYEEKRKYVLRGVSGIKFTTLDNKTEEYGGTYKKESLKDIPSLFQDFLIKRWQEIKYENID